MKQIITIFFLIITSTAFADPYKCGKNIKRATVYNHEYYCKCTTHYGNTEYSDPDENGKCPIDCRKSKVGTSQKACEIAENIAAKGSEEKYCPEKCPYELPAEVPNYEVETVGCTATELLYCEDPEIPEA